MIYGRWHNPVELVRMGTLADVKELDKRKADKQDRDAVKAGSYVVVRDVEADKLRLYHLGYLRESEHGEITRELRRIA